MRKKDLEKIFAQIDPKEALINGMMARFSYEFLIEELIKGHPNPKAAFNDTIKKYPALKQRITDLADLLKLDLGEDYKKY